MVCVACRGVHQTVGVFPTSDDIDDIRVVSEEARGRTHVYLFFLPGISVRPTAHALLVAVATPVGPA